MQRDWHEFLSDKELEELDRKAEEKAKELVEEEVKRQVAELEDNWRRKVISSMIGKGKKPEEICDLCDWSKDQLKPYLN